MTPPLTPDAVREMLAEATPGPWKLALNPEGDYIICQDATGDALATEWFGSVPNTQLMSATPALAQAWLDAVEWRPIETAPKDGTRILTCRPGAVPAVSFWQTHFGESRFGEDPETFMEQAHFEEYWQACDYQPTHWRPLPQPPSPQEPSHDG
ncbi:MAG: hypothetical protein WBF53_11515 [Litorimonas sp.]